MAENLSNDFATALSAGIDNVTTALSVTSGAGAPAVNFRIRIDDELMLVTSKGAGTNWTVQRGIEGTTAVLHLSVAPVVHVITFGGLSAHGDENFAAKFPGVATGKVRLVPANHQFIVVEELVVEGELIVDGSIYILPLS